MTTVDIRESEIEDIFAQYPLLLRDALGLAGDVYLIARKKAVPSGRLDLVYAHMSNLLLVELKVETFRDDFVTQVSGYRDDLLNLQREGEFVKGEIDAILLCPEITRTERIIADRRGVKAITYSPAEVLLAFFRDAPLDARYLTVEPADTGVWRIGLISQSLYALSTTRTIREISSIRGQSPKTVSNQIRLAEGLGLVQRMGRSPVLSTDGEEYVKARDFNYPQDMLSAEQAILIRKSILTNPFFSGVTFGILTMAACIFELSKNTYPVPLEIVSSHFISAAGLLYRWDSKSAIRHGVRMYTNYAIDLGLVGKVGNNYFVTPSGLSFVLLLNMHKSLKLIENTSRIE